LRALLATCLLAASLVSQDTIRIGAKRFTESAVLAELMAQTIEAHTELTVEVKTGLGGTMICWGALTTGELDIYAEYTGTGWATILGQTDKVTDPLRTFFEVRRRFRDEHDAHWLEPFGLNNGYALVMREKTAEELGVRRISDLVRHQRDLQVGFGNEFGSRIDGYRGLAVAYGLNFANLTTVEHALAYEAIEAGSIDLMDAYSTDGKLLRFELRVLEDDRQFFPPYNAAPVVRGETLRKHPGIETALAKLAFQVSDLDAQALNYIVDAEGISPADAATAFLEIEGLIEGTSASAAAARRAYVRVRKSPPIPGSAVASRQGVAVAASARGVDVGSRAVGHLDCRAVWYRDRVPASPASLVARVRWFAADHSKLGVARVLDSFLWTQRMDRNCGAVPLRPVADPTQHLHRHQWCDA
jgi:osmoprotectant transport system substrate-binding protein